MLSYRVLCTRHSTKMLLREQLMARNIEPIRLRRDMMKSAKMCCTVASIIKCISQQLFGLGEKNG